MREELEALWEENQDRKRQLQTTITNCEKELDDVEQIRFKLKQLLYPYRYGMTKTEKIK